MFTLESVKRFIDKNDWDTIKLYENLEDKDVQCFYISPPIKFYSMVVSERAYAEQKLQNLIHQIQSKYGSNFKAMIGTRNNGGYYISFYRVNEIYPLIKIGFNKHICVIPQKILKNFTALQ